ncbi:protein-L-isoaspartate(D-aspartate) O-methyltransferase [candidate division WOR-3 bacterium]|nr:protein-L-isoaspartate(D-aspartate) O-methyltransferase [candidate division WOR-3 bacterium]
MYILVILLIMFGRTDDYALSRETMIQEQIIRRGITDELVIQAMRQVPREEFVPDKYKPYAYIDSPLPIEYDQTISQPFIVALMNYLIDVQEGERVLEIGTGSGYSAAVLSEMGADVYTIELLEPLATSAVERLKKLGYDNIKVKCGDGFFGWDEYAPFDGIVVTCAPGYIPQPLVDQLDVGGRMVIPVGDLFQELILLTKTAEGVIEDSILPVRFVPMKGEVEKRDE